MKTTNPIASASRIALIALAFMATPSWKASVASPLAILNPPTLCSDVEFFVTLAPGDPATHRVVGQLCAKPSLRRRVIHVLVSGATYGHVYWDFPLRPGQYSYVKALTDAGYATLNLDRIGIGQSDHPPAAQVTIESNAFVRHQIVQTLREGSLTRFSFSKVILVAHSLGSGIALVEASTYADVDGVVATGFLHTFGPAFGAVPAVLYPAQAQGSPHIL